MHCIDSKRVAQLRCWGTLLECLPPPQFIRRSLRHYGYWEATLSASFNRTGRNLSVGPRTLRLLRGDAFSVFQPYRSQLRFVWRLRLSECRVMFTSTLPSVSRLDVENIIWTDSCWKCRPMMRFDESRMMLASILPNLSIFDVKMTSNRGSKFGGIG